MNTSRMRRAAAPHSFKIDRWRWKWYKRGDRHAIATLRSRLLVSRVLERRRDAADSRHCVQTGTEEMGCRTAQDTHADVAARPRSDGHAFPQASAWCARVAGHRPSGGPLVSDHRPSFGLESGADACRMATRPSLRLLSSLMGLFFRKQLLCASVLK
jgi:hypothetical protein